MGQSIPLPVDLRLPDPVIRGKIDYLPVAPEKEAHGFLGCAVGKGEKEDIGFFEEFFLIERFVNKIAASMKMREYIRDFPARGFLRCDRSNPDPVMTGQNTQELDAGVSTSPANSHFYHGVTLPSSAVR
jgi:hypothetical protein